MDNHDRKYTVPENYFSNLENEILSKTVDKQTQPKPIVRSMRLVWSSAAAVLVLAACAYLLWPSGDTTPDTEQYAELEDQLFEEFFADDIVASDEMWDEMASFFVDLEQ